MMTAVEFIGSDLKRLHKMLDRALDELTPEQLHTVPAGHATANTTRFAATCVPASPRQASA